MVIMNPVSRLKSQLRHAFQSLGDSGSLCMIGFGWWARANHELWDFDFG